MAKSDELLECYVKAVNRLDDYFEYRCESDKDRQYVYHTLNLLSKELEEVSFKED
jgi:hypothetical protein